MFAVYFTLLFAPGVVLLTAIGIGLGVARYMLGPDRFPSSSGTIDKK